MTYCRCYSCKYLLRYELKTECGQICAFFVTAGVGLISFSSAPHSWHFSASQESSSSILTNEPQAGQRIRKIAEVLTHSLTTTVSGRDHVKRSPRILLFTVEP